MFQNALAYAYLATDPEARLNALAGTRRMRPMSQCDLELAWPTRMMYACLPIRIWIRRKAASTRNRALLER